MIAEWVVWLIFLLPLASFAIISLVIRPFLDRFSLFSGLLLSASLLVSFLLLGLAALAERPRGASGVRAAPVA